MSATPGESAARRRAVLLACAFVASAMLAACDGARPSDGGRPADGGFGGDDLVELPPLPRACPDVYADELLPTFEVEIAEEDWAALHQDVLEGEEVFYPVVFRHGAAVVPDAMMRLRGNNSRCGDKLQFAISFNQVDRAGRFGGLRRLNLDHGGCAVLEERLALSFMRDLGLPAACANHARLVVNGRYYGLFLSIEHVNKDFLRRNFGEAADDGNLYKSGWRLRTNEEENDTSDLAAYQQAADPGTVAALVDLEEAIAEWAAEAALPARDNYWLRGYNYYLYHHPSRGFLFIPTDLDQAFPATSSDVRLATLVPDVMQHPASIVLADPEWRRRYEEALRRTLAAYDPDLLAARLHRWWEQIAEAAEEDPFSSPSAAEVSALEARIRERAAWLRGALDAPLW